MPSVRPRRWGRSQAKCVEAEERMKEEHSPVWRQERGWSGMGQSIAFYGKDLEFKAWKWWGMQVER